MWFKLNLNGIVMNMRIKGYESSEKISGIINGVMLIFPL